MLEQRIEEVNTANRAFYAAFGNLDINEMDKVWAHQEYVTCIHPVGRCGRTGLRSAILGPDLQQYLFHDVCADRRDGAGGGRFGLGRLRGAHHYPSIRRTAAGAGVSHEPLRADRG